MRPIEAMARAALAERQSAGLLRGLRWIDGPQDPWVECDGERVLLLCSNNYLGLASHPALAAAAAAAMHETGVGAGASRLVSGSMRIHRELEERLAAWKQTEAALIFPTGYHANIGAIPALVQRGDAVFSDELNHASLIDGCRLSGAEIQIYPHADIEALDRLLRAVAARYKLIVTDTVFSMDGDIAPLAEICDLAERHSAYVMVDDAHGTGVLGASGGGAIEELGLHGRVDVQVATLSKALGTCGGAVCASRLVIDLVLNRARSFIYTTGISPPIAAATLAAIDLAQHQSERRAAMQTNATRLRTGLRDLGYRVEAGITPIIPIIVGESAEAMELSKRLFAEGIFVQAIRPPTVPRGTARLRATVMATHTAGDIDFAVEAFQRVRASTVAAASGA